MQNIRHPFKHAERGDANIIMIVLLVIVVIGIFVGFQILPLRWDHAKFGQQVQTVMISTLVPPYKDVAATVTQKITTLLDSMGARYQKEHIQVEVGAENKNLHVRVWYTRPHHLPLYQNPKQFYLELDHTPLLPQINIPKRATIPPIE